VGVPTGEDLPVVGDTDCNRLTIYSERLSSSSREVALAARRLLNSRRREDEVDEIVDVCVALEALAGDSTPTEMTHKTSMRVAAILAHDGCAKSAEIFHAMKKVYGYRSAVVHGRADYKTKQWMNVFGLKLQTVFVGRFLLSASLGAILSKPELFKTIADDSIVLDMIAEFAKADELEATAESTESATAAKQE